MHATTLNNSEGVPPDGPQAPPSGRAEVAEPHAAHDATSANPQTAAVKDNVSADRKDAKGKEEEWPEGVDPANAEHGLSAQQVLYDAQPHRRCFLSRSQQASSQQLRVQL